jgi:membrane protein involved in colicin uptake
MNVRLTLLLCGLFMLEGCTEEVPPRSVQEFLADPNSLEAAVVRCSQNRSQMRYEAECVNARQAISIMEAKQERARRDAFEAESDKKRQALRRTQQAAAEARRRAEEAAQRRREAEYLAQFGEMPPAESDNAGVDEAAMNAPGAVIPAPDAAATPLPRDEQPATDGGNAPVAEPSPPAADIDAVREELRKRSEETGG